MKLIAIDPGSNKCGIAEFVDGKLAATTTLVSKAATPLARRLEIAERIERYYFDWNFDEVTSEEPLLLGRNNNYMQRLLGCIEQITKGRVHFIHPMTVKSKIAGSGKADKLELALAAGEKLKTESEKEILADAIAREAFDETDAVAIGLVYLGGLNDTRAT